MCCKPRYCDGSQDSTGISHVPGNKQWRISPIIAFPWLFPHVVIKIHDNMGIYGLRVSKILKNIHIYIIHSISPSVLWINSPIVLGCLGLSILLRRSLSIPSRLELVRSKRTRHHMASNNKGLEQRKKTSNTGDT